MADDVDNIVLEQLRLIREAIGVVDAKVDRVAEQLQTSETRLWDKIDELEEKVDGQMGLIVGLGHYIRDIDGRVQAIEGKLEVVT